MQHVSNDPLHGITLNAMMEYLVETYGWETLGKRIPIKCFTTYPSIKSSLIFLRKTPWAREKVELLYLDSVSPGHKRPEKTYGDIQL